MFTYLLRRICLLVFVLWGVSVLTFTLMYLLPGERARLVAIYRWGYDDLSAKELATLRREIGEDLPFPQQYAWWLGRVARGDLGYSFVTGRPVAAEILARVPATLELAVAAFFFAALTAVPLGIACARRPGSWWDNLLMTGSLIGVAMPNFWLGLLLILIFSLTLDLLPVAGSGGLAHLVLPAFTLGAGMAAVSTRLVRASLLEVLAQDYITMARTKGLGEGEVLWRHALRNALIPVFTVLGLQLNHLVGGTVIVENVFGRAGVGQLMVEAIASRDLPLLQGVVLFLAFCFAGVNLLVDISYTFLDPRIRYGGAKGNE
ncbi:MAG: ABC transporter permease [Clostridia bacterium]|nr:MAG: ABC transporter permease [Clostridia bacterium]